MGSRHPEGDISFTLLPAELRYGPAHALGDVLASTYGYGATPSDNVAAVHPAVMARIVGYDCRLADLRWRLKCRMCGAKRVGVGMAIPGGEVRRSAAVGRPTRRTLVAEALRRSGTCYLSSRCWVIILLLTCLSLFPLTL